MCHSIRTKFRVLGIYNFDLLYNTIFELRFDSNLDSKSVYIHTSLFGLGDKK